MDEVKYQVGVEPYYWLCGLALPEEMLQPTEERLIAVAEEYFETPFLTPETELHAKDFFQGKANFKGHDLQRRLALYKQLIDVIDECEGLKRVAVRIDPSKMIANEYTDKAFMFFVERVNGLMCGMKSLAMIIADHDKEMVWKNVSALSNYKRAGTSYQYGTVINRIVDTVHHTHSHHSRLIQLADVYAYSMSLLNKPHDKYPRSVIASYIASKQNFAFPSTYKYWPTEQSWHKPLNHE
jgi:hypothetical protein